MNCILHALVHAAAQVDSAVTAGSAAADPATDKLWPYTVAIASLASVVVTLFTLLVKSYRDRTEDQKEHAASLKGQAKAFVEAQEERSKRVSSEFKEKDEAILRTSVEFATLMQKVAQELALLNDRERTR